MNPEPNIPVCCDCGSPEITTDATAHFDLAKREWVLLEVTDGKSGNWCHNCEGPTGAFDDASDSDVFDVFAFADRADADTFSHGVILFDGSRALEKRVGVPFAQLSEVMGELTEKHGWSVARHHEEEE